MIAVFVAAADDAEGSLAERLSTAYERVSASVHAGDGMDVLTRWIEYGKAHAGA